MHLAIYEFLICDTSFNSARNLSYRFKSMSQVPPPSPRTSAYLPSSCDLLRSLLCCSFTQAELKNMVRNVYFENRELKQQNEQYRAQIMSMREDVRAVPLFVTCWLLLVTCGNVLTGFP